jgi:hypothetical protein
MIELIREFQPLTEAGEATLVAYIAVLLTVLAVWLFVERVLKLFAWIARGISGRPCPACKERVRPTALVCPYCHFRM